MVEIGLAGAFLGGVVTLLSPCSVMLLPAFFAYSFARTGTLVGRTSLFLLGLLATLVPLGVGAGSLGVLLASHRQALVLAGSLLVMVLGVLVALGVQVPGLGRASGGASPAAVFTLGMTYGLAGTCTGPILGSLLTYAALAGSAVYGGLLFVSYALGMVAPLFVLALAWDRVGLRDAAWLRPRPVRLGRFETTVTGLVSGALLVGLGVLLLVTDGTTSLGGVLGVADQARLEVAVRDWAEGFPDLSVLAGLLVAAVLVGWGWAASRRRRDPA